MKKTVLLVFGTRPEAVKMCPLVRELRARRGIRTFVCTSGQHRELLDPVLRAFSVTPDFDLALMRAGQTLSDIAASILTHLPPILEQVQPHAVLVHGDTATAFAVALAAFHQRIPVGHVEAGLRTYDIKNPFPEEYYRRAISLLATLHFAPTAHARDNLLAEGCARARIFVTGNTVLDALATTLRAEYSHPALTWAADSRLVLLTAHRRESIGEPLRQIFRAVRRATKECTDVKLLYPIHMNPAVRAIAEEELGGLDRLRIIEPLAPPDFHNFLARAYLVLTDSGGIQEEAAALGKPTLVLREATERPEGVAAGVLRLVGTQEAEVYRHIRQLLADGAAYAAMASAPNPYGDGYASRRIADALLTTLALAEK